MTQVLSDGRIEFRFFLPGVGHVKLAGDFNGWQPVLSLSPADTDGWWSLRLAIPPGEYRFRYEVDGRWFTDFASDGVEPCPFGLNSVLIVPPARAL